MTDNTTYGYIRKKKNWAGAKKKLTVVDGICCSPPPWAAAHWEAHWEAEFARQVSLLKQLEIPLLNIPKQVPPIADTDQQNCTAFGF
eukprot:SAG11_NODE_23822_length_382_cov_2.565371_1_plen_86_part_10